MCVCTSTPPGITYRSVASISTSAWTGMPHADRGHPLVLDHDVGLRGLGRGHDRAALDEGPHAFELLPWRACVPASSDGGPRPANRRSTGARYPPPVSTSDWHVAQVNIALLRAPLDSPQLQDFVSMLEPINALADGSPGLRVEAPDRDRRRHRDPRVRRRSDHREPVGVGDDRGARAVRLRLPAQRGPAAPARLVRTDGRGPSRAVVDPRPGPPRPSRRPSGASRPCANAARPRTPSRSGSRSPPPARTSPCPPRTGGATPRPRCPREVPCPIPAGAGSVRPFRMKRSVPFLVPLVAC